MTAPSLAQGFARAAALLSRPASNGLLVLAFLAIASGSMTSMSLNLLVRVSVDFPHPFGPAMTTSVGIYCLSIPGPLSTRSPFLDRAMYLPSLRYP